MIRFATPADYSWMSALHGQHFPRGWNEEEVRELAGQRAGYAFVAEQDGQPAGYILLRELVDEAEIITLVVRETSKRQGMALALLNFSRATLSAKGIKTLFLEVADDNTAARALYEKSGFQLIGRRKGYYLRLGSTRADALLMHLTLI